MTGNKSQSRNRTTLSSLFVKLLKPWVTIPVTLLLLVLAGMFTYRGSRFHGIPPIGEVVDRETEGRIEIKHEENAFTYYERAWKQLPETLNDKALGEAVDALRAGGGWSNVTPEAKAALAGCDTQLDEWKRGTECERGVRVQSADAEWYDIVGVQKSRGISRLVILKSEFLINKGHTDEAWKWLRSLLRFSRHFGNPGHSFDRLVGTSFHAMSSEAILRWAADNAVTFSQLETANKEVRSIYRLTANSTEILKHGYLTSSRLLAQPKLLEELGFFAEVVPEEMESVSGIYLFLNAEPQLTNLLRRHVYANYLSQCDRPRCERVFAGTRYPLFKPTRTERPPLMDPMDLYGALARSRLANLIGPDIDNLLDMTDRELACQTALELCLTVEMFRRKRGRYPERLNELVPEFVDKIPRDLYGRAPNDRLLMARRQAEESESDSEKKGFYSGPGLVIYSRGENGIDDGGDLRLADIGLKIPLSQTENGHQ